MLGGKKRVLEAASSTETFNKRYQTLGDPLAYSGISNVTRITGQRVKDVEDRLAGIFSYTLHREYKKPRHYNPFFIYFARQQLQVDLIDISDLAQDNDGVTFLMTAIDVFTKKAWVEPMKNKKGVTAKNVLEKIFRDMNTLPKQIFFDRGSEFVNSYVRDFLKKAHVKIVHPGSTLKAPVIERFNRTFQNLLYRHTTEMQNYRYIDDLQHIVRTYNRRRHRTIDMSPNDAELEKNWADVRNAHSEKYTRLVNLKKKKSKFALGDTVRIKKLVRNFGRGYHEQFKRELFKVVQVDRGMPITMYELRSLDTDELVEGKFYSNELQKVISDIFKVEKVVKKRMRNGKEEYLVKWLDFGARHNSWVAAEDMFTQPKKASHDDDDDDDSTNEEQ